jgi:hypothetical protein
MNAFTTPTNSLQEPEHTKFLHTMQATQAKSLLEAQAKNIFNIGREHLAPNRIFKKKL